MSSNTSAPAALARAALAAVLPAAAASPAAASPAAAVSPAAAASPAAAVSPAAVASPAAAALLAAAASPAAAAVSPAAAAAPTAAAASGAAAAPPLVVVTLPPLPPRRTAAMTSLLALPFLRLPVPRPGRNPHTARPSNLEAWLGQVTGQVQALGCGHCVGGSGQWTLCVTVAGHFGDSCTNCHYDSEGARCSFRPAAASAPPPAAARPSRLLRQVATGARIVDRVAPGTIQVRVRHRRTPAARARRLATLFGEMAETFNDEAEERRRRG